MLNFLKNLSPTELIIIAVILIGLFGSKIFISLGRTAGESVKEIKNIKKSFTDVVEDSDKKEDK